MTKKDFQSSLIAQKSLFTRFKKPSRSRYAKLFFKHRKGDSQRSFYSDFSTYFSLFDKRIFFLAQVLTRHGKLKGVYTQLLNVFRSFYWKIRHFGKFTWFIELRQSHQKPEFLVKIIKGIYEREQAKDLEEKKNIKKIKKLRQSMKNI
jgi:hypothetical protein